jgi:hypothetical protein
MTDMLNMEYINSLPQPFIVTFYGDNCAWPVIDICVETGCMSIDVCGIHQGGKHISDVKKLVDCDGIEYDIDTFYLDSYLE